LHFQIPIGIFAYAQSGSNEREDFKAIGAVIQYPGIQSHVPE